MKKKLLFVIPNLGAGGAEKSLVNLLNVIDSKKYSVDLFLFYHSGLFFNQLPAFVKILPTSKLLQTFQKPLLQSVFHYLRNGQFALAINRINFTKVQYFRSNKSRAEQDSWQYKSKAFENLPEKYDVAIGFLEKSSIYFVVEKVHATKKIGWMHNDYNALGMNIDFDALFFKNLTYLITVSDECADVLRSNFPTEKDKVIVIHNITSSSLVKKMSIAHIDFNSQKSILSVGRLHPQKGFDLAIEAAKILKEKGINFNWSIIGEGEERKNLENLISKYHLQDCFHLLGLKENPYPFIKKATIFVQPSRYEGKSICVDEAKILAKPIVLTNFTTAKDQIQHHYNGLICEMSPHSLADSILKYFNDPEFTENVVRNLKAEEFGTEDEIKKLYQLIDA